MARGSGNDWDEGSVTDMALACVSALLSGMGEGSDALGVGGALESMAGRGLITSTDTDTKFTDEGFARLNETLEEAMDRGKKASAFEPGCAAYVLRVSFLFEEAEVWRTIKVPVDITFADLQVIIMALLGWLNVLAFKFSYVTPDGKLQCMTEDAYDNNTYYECMFSYSEGEVEETEDWRDPSDVVLSTVIPSMDHMVYTYDYATCWQIGIACEGESTLEDGLVVCTGGEGATPPETCDGEDGYLDMLDVLSDSDNPGFATTAAWALAHDFDDFDIESANERLKTWQLYNLRVRHHTQGAPVVLDNAKHLGLFLKSLAGEELSEREANSLGDNVNDFVVDYLIDCRDLGVREGIGEVGDYLGDYLLDEDHEMPSPAEFEDIVDSIKRFYRWMLDTGRVDQEAFDDMLKVIEEGRPDWLNFIREH